MCVRRFVRDAAHTCVGGDPTNAYLYCVYVLIVFVIHIIIICAVSRVCAYVERIARCLPQARCLCSENGAIGFKLVLKLISLGKKRLDTGAA